MIYYVVVAREEYKEEDVFYYRGNYSSEDEDIEDCYVHIDFIFKSESPIKWIYD